MTNQHYVPQALLKNFAFDSLRRQVYVLKKDLAELHIKRGSKGCLDKVTCVKNIKKICSEFDYLSTKSKNFDNEFAKIDNEAPLVINKILSFNSSNELCEADKEVLAQFAAYQYVRGQASRQIATQVFDNYFNYAGINDFLELIFPSITVLKKPEEYIKEMQGNCLLEVNKLISFFNSLVLNVVIKEDGPHEFVIGDSPVLYDATGYGIYVPISPNKCLWFHHQEIATPLQSQYLNELQFLASTRHLIAHNQESLNYIFSNSVTSTEIEQLEDSYWKCILETKNSKYCIKKYSSLIESNTGTYF